MASFVVMADGTDTDDAQLHQFEEVQLGSEELTAQVAAWCPWVPHRMRGGRTVLAYQEAVALFWEFGRVHNDLNAPYPSTAMGPVRLAAGFAAVRSDLDPLFSLQP